MKRTIISILAGAALVVGLFFGYTLLQSSHPKIEQKPSLSTDQLQTLQAMGFNNCENLNLGDNYDRAANPGKVKFYHEKYGLRYFSDPGVAKMMKEFGYVLGSAKDFIKEIPAANIAEMQKNFAMVSSGMEKTFYYFEGTGDPIGWIPLSNIKPEAIKRIDADGWVWLGDAVYDDIYSPKNMHALAIRKSTTAHSVSDPAIMVVAPKEDFNLDGNEIVDNTVVKKHVDPMIVARIPDGYLVLTQW